VDFIEGFMDYTEHRPSPAIFRKWAAIATLSGATERRVWSLTVQGKQYSNIYVMLVAPPGIGKSQSVGPAKTLLLKSSKFFIAPDRLSTASLIDAFARCSKEILLTPNHLLHYHHLYIIAGEMGSLMSSHDLDFLSFINVLFDNEAAYREEKRHSIKDPIDISNPHTAILIGTQPGFLGAVLPEASWTMGFTSRLIMVYSDEDVDAPIFGDFVDKSDIEKKLVKRLVEMSEWKGEMSWSQDALREVKRWSDEKFEPIPDHPKLRHYAPRRGKVMWIKLSMTSALSRGKDLLVQLEDVERARAWLLEAEETMPQIFRAMTSKSDEQVIDETFTFIMQQFAMTKKPITGESLNFFLKSRSTVDKTDKIVDMLEKSGMVERVGGGMAFIPKMTSLKG
jgi:hypothetical protein